ncbi:MAG: CvpA family protein [Methylococcales bacterium]|nr:CvpA family protein [Methylococcales bacterium]
MFPVALKPFIWVDYSIVAVCGVTMTIGMMRGFSREVVALLLWVIGFWVSLHFSANFSTTLQDLILSPKKRFAVTFIGLFVATIMAGSFIQNLLLTRFKQTYNHTAFMERLGGLLCGMMQGIVITSIVVFLAGFSPLPHKNWWIESSLLPSFQLLTVWLRDNIALKMALTV